MKEGGDPKNLNLLVVKRNCARTKMARFREDLKFKKSMKLGGPC